MVKLGFKPIILIIGMIILIPGLMIISIENVGAQIAGTTLNSLGYTDTYLSTNDAIYGGPIDITGPYSHSPQNGNITSQILIGIYSGATLQGATVNFNFKLADGSTHSGTYQYQGNNTYAVTLDGLTQYGTFTYTIWDTLDSWMGRTKGLTFAISYATKLNDSSNYAVYVSDSAAQGDTSATILEPLNPNTNMIIAWSVNTNTKINLQWVDDAAPEFVTNNINPNAAISNTDFLTLIRDLIDQFAGGLISTGQAMIGLVVMLGEMAAFFLNPAVLILIFCQAEGLMAIVALSKKGNMIDSIFKFAGMNSAFLSFILMFAAGMVTVYNRIIIPLAEIALAIGTQAASSISSIALGIIALLK